MTEHRSSCSKNEVCSHMNMCHICANGFLCLNVNGFDKSITFTWNCLKFDIGLIRKSQCFYHIWKEINNPLCLIDFVAGTYLVFQKIYFNFHQLWALKKRNKNILTSIIGFSKCRWTGDVICPIEYGLLKFILCVRIQIIKDVRFKTWLILQADIPWSPAIIYEIGNNFSLEFLECWKQKKLSLFISYRFQI